MDLSVLAEDPFPAIALVGGGLLSCFIAFYGKRDDSHLDELATYAGFIIGVVMAVMAVFVAIRETVGWFSLVMLILLAVTLFLKPMKEIPWAGIAGLIAGSFAAYGASIILPASLVTGENRWIALAVVFFVVGLIVHLFFHFVEDLLKITRMILDWRPIMVIVGIVALIEGVLLFSGSSLASFFLG